MSWHVVKPARVAAIEETIETLDSSQTTVLMRTLCPTLPSHRDVHEKRTMWTFIVQDSNSTIFYGLW